MGIMCMNMGMGLNLSLGNVYFVRAGDCFRSSSGNRR